MSAKLRKFFSQLTYLPATGRLIWQAAGRWTLAWAVLLLVQGLLPAASVYLTGVLVDSLAASVGGGLSWASIRPTLIWAGLMGLVLVLTQVFQSILEYVRTAQSELIQDHLSQLVHEKSAALDLSFYESPESQDRLYRAQRDLKTRPLALLESAGSFVQSGVTLLAVASILLPYGWWLPLVLLFSTSPAFYVILRYNRLYHRWWEQTTTDRRWLQYFDTILTVDTVAADLRLFGFGPRFQAAFQRMRQRLRTERLVLMKQQSAARLGAGVLAALMAAGAMGWMVWQAFLGRVTLGDLALFYQAFNRGQGLLGNLLTNAGRIYDNVLFLENLFEFLEMQPQIVDPPQPVPAPAVLRQGIRFENVSFRYPNSDRLVFRDFNFEVPAGKIVAIVGANGAGKTTLIKLLCRFYDPVDGRILFDGHDLRELAVADLRRMLTGIFQFPVPYVSTVTENVAMGVPEAEPRRSEVQAAARRAGAHDFIMRLPAGYDTLLGKLFPSGTELSGGEWQRLALARSFFRQAPIMILDEPTSMLDSWAEVDWFDRFRELAAGRTAILITHRLMIAKQADMIHVLDAGEIVESGTHEALLAQNGRYAQSWQAQVAAPRTANGAAAPVLGVLPGAGVSAMDLD
ncbi:MAG: ABC transporter ATP-binding protein [Anaerolineales bacterium]|nr:ABC transporter ATP-binding protein [Anaerolineales bacterium]